MHLLFAFLFLSAPPISTDTVTVEAELPAVSVVATRIETATAGAPARISILDPREVEAFSGRSVADLLAARSTATIRRYGPSGVASVSLRGTSASQTLILLDGQRIADPQLGQLDLSLLPTILLDRVEILHGAGGAIHGTDGIGGVINLRTLSPERSSLDATLSAGAFGERTVGVRAAGVSGRIRAIVAAEASALEGDFPFFNRRLGPTGEIDRRQGADRQHASALGRLEARLGSTTVFAAFWAGTADTGVPGSVGAPVPARQQDEHLRLWTGASMQRSWGVLQARGLVQRSQLTYNADAGRTTLASVEVEARVPGSWWMISAGANAGLGHARHDSIDDEASESRLGAFVVGTARLGRWLLYPAIRGDLYLREDDASKSIGALSPRLGANWKPLNALPMHVKLGVGTAFRAPTFNDRFWRYDGATVAGGNPDLRPERGWTADLGAVLDLTLVSIEATTYLSRLRDQIVWLPGEGGLFSALNLQSTRTLGAELSVDSSPISLGAASLNGGLTYAFTDARDVRGSASTSLRYVPRHGATAHANATTSVTSSAEAAAGLQARYVGRRPIRTDGTLHQPAHLVVDASLSLRQRFHTTTVEVSAHLENLLDADYAILRGYPMPPRHARFSLRLTL